MSTIIDWRPNAGFGGDLERRLQRGMTRAVLFVEAEVIRSISIGQAVKRSKGGRLRGLNPSRPGEPPHVLYGRLKQSIKHVVEMTAAGIVGRVGTNVVYARRLELGYVGTDKKGRNVNQAPRPFLRPAILNNRSRIFDLITRG